MKKRLFFLLTAFMSLNLHAQEVPDTTEKIIQTNLISENASYHLLMKHWYLGNDSSSFSNYRYKFGLKFSDDKEKTFSSRHLDAVNKVLPKGPDMYDISLLFIDRSVGFIYGYSENEARNPFLFRTEDGGHTWQTVFANTAGTPFRRRDFWMFTELKGIILNNLNSEPNFNYLLTEDGGKTWQQKSFKISRDDIRISNKGQMLDAFYTSSSITVSLKNPDPLHPNGVRQLMIQSTDFGHSFVELNY